ncbi:MULTISPECIES: glycine betaine ABC transporter substrate-binding protein [unclassified Frigoribacterium]|jgi:osmoprotectant transport system substrate-binding protein|uniref:glycine betaine ABC transporter substrate-binding protein n=1 Tax=unclassified Frigoribacterium TaxID=2627005 RepID=UPI000F472D20|nr:MULTISPECIES: glycine betaine ABC transporter substrate-binding protein [unclassified Frigoribacterium]MBF4578190.1 glycine betaine ABC transporter substrate-binding protein [Frigoribacterium sp. VKM Ac-2530]ROP77651.1 osmoprotectant transport system substrate-binding protein [Frigoribacterium sp. PhB107]TDT65492.1 osmoprotectant transport system substrate-binding protein [Frigoribacterium sp. PhB116]
MTPTDDRRPRLRALRRASLLGVVAASSAALLTGCGLQPATAFVPAVAPGSIEAIDDLPDDAAITVTAKNFTEQLILGKIAVLAAQAAGFEVTDMTNVPGSVAVRQLMLDGGADMTYEYTGTAWLTYLGEAAGIPDKQEQYEAVRDADEANGLVWLEPAPLNNTYAMAVRSEAVAELGDVATLSQIAALPVDQRTFCVEAEFNSRADGFAPMLERYGLELGAADGVPTSNVSILDTGTVYEATDRGRCNFGEVFTTDGRIDSLDLTVLEDDQGFFPAYNVAPVLTDDVLATYPQLAAVYEQISPALTDDELRTLNRRVDVEGEEPADVAFDWMVEKGFVTRP